MQIGLDIGSTTIKIAVLDDAGKLLFSKYARQALALPKAAACSLCRKFLQKKYVRNALTRIRTLLLNWAAKMLKYYF